MQDAQVLPAAAAAGSASATVDQHEQQAAQDADLITAATPAWRQRLDALGFTPEQKGILLVELTRLAPEDREVVVDSDATVARAALERLLAAAAATAGAAAGGQVGLVGCQALRIVVYEEDISDHIVEYELFEDLKRLRGHASSAR